MPAFSPRSRRRLPLAALGLAALFAAFGAGLVHLLQLRFDVGDVYPPYSTLRSDPLGAKVFYDSLQALPGLDTARSLRPLPLLGVPAFTRPGDDHGEARFACFYLGADPARWPYLLSADAAARLEHIAARGGRIIVTFQPTAAVPADERPDPRPETHQDPPPKKGQPPPARKRTAASPEPESDLSLDWGIGFRRQKARAGGGQPAAANPSKASQALPVPPMDGPPVAWHTALGFELDTPEAHRAGWRALYQCEGRPVVVARPWGNAGGELILASDTYFLSNEGLHEAAHPALLAALVGPAQTLLFDESHFGIKEDLALMTLARHYRLQGALAALGLLAGLFVWRNAVSLVPPRAAADAAAAGGAPAAGRDAAAGFLNLLQRGVAPRDLPALCVAQWRQHLSPAAGGTATRQRATPANVASLEAVLAGTGAARGTDRRSPAALYRELCARLRRSRNDE